MTDTQMWIFELGSKGYNCSQILMLMALQLQGEENPALIRASSVLAQGLANTGGFCGALSGGLCLISLYTAKGNDEDKPDPREEIMWEELIDWFDNVSCPQKNHNCDAILGLAENNPMTSSRLMQGGSVCAGLVGQVFEKCLEILQKNEIDPRSAKVVE